MLKKQSNLLPRSRRKYSNTIENFLSGVGPGEVAAEINNFLSDRNSPAYKYAFKYFLKMIKREDCYPQLIKIKIPPVKRHGVFISRAEQVRILENIPDDYYYTIAVIQFYTGARVHDVLGLRKDDVKFTKDLITLYLRVKGEKEQIRVIPADLPAVPGIQDFIMRSKKEYPLLKGESKDLTLAIDNNYRYYHEAIKEAAIRAGIGRFNPHDFRRNFGTELYRVTRDPLLVKAALGHADLKDTMKYIKEIEQEKITAAIKKMHEESK